MSVAEIVVGAIRVRGARTGDRALLGGRTEDLARRTNTIAALTGLAVDTLHGLTRLTLIIDAGLGAGTDIVIVAVLIGGALALRDERRETSA